MGNNNSCSCLRKDLSFSHDVGLDSKKENNQYILNHLQVLENHENISVSKHTKINSFIDNEPKELNKDKLIENSKAGFKIYELNENVKNIISQEGEFVINKEELNEIGEEVFTKPPVLIENNYIYVGTWNSSNQKHGLGSIYFPEGGLFEGIFKNDFMNGKGRLINCNGDFYEGEFVENKANGMGKYISGDGVTFVGYWKNDKQHGKGEENYKDGSKFVGNFQNGEKNGKGVFTWSDGSIFEGEFVNNAIQGKGIYKWKDGRFYNGDWVSNKMEGYGYFQWSDNKKYYGQYKDDKKSGFGVFLWPDGKRYEGFWSHGKQNGYGIIYFKGTKRWAEWKNGKKLRNIDDTVENKTLIDTINNKIKENLRIIKQSDYYFQSS